MGRVMVKLSSHVARRRSAPFFPPRSLWRSQESCATNPTCCWDCGAPTTCACCLVPHSAIMEQLGLNPSCLNSGWAGNVRSWTLPPTTHTCHHGWAASAHGHGGGGRLFQSSPRQPSCLTEEPGMCWCCGSARLAASSPDIQHIRSVSERLLPPGVLARLRLVPTSCTSPPPFSPFPLSVPSLCCCSFTRGTARLSPHRSHTQPPPAAGQERAGGCGPTAARAGCGCAGPVGCSRPVRPALPHVPFPSGPAPPRAAVSAAAVPTYINSLFLSDRSPSRCLTPRGAALCPWLRVPVGGAVSRSVRRSCRPSVAARWTKLRLFCMTASW